MLQVLQPRIGTKETRGTKETWETRGGMIWSQSSQNSQVLLLETALAHNSHKISFIFLCLKKWFLKINNPN